MKNIGIFYGSSNGTTEEVAQLIGSKLGVDGADIHNISSASANDLENYECLLLGSSTWGSGDLQDDWFDFVNELKKANIAGKKVALFGCGDSATFSDTFCDAIGTLYQEVIAKDCVVVGSVDTDGYSFDESTAVVDGKFVGLAIDDMNESDLTGERIDAWVEQLKAQF